MTVSQFPFAPDECVVQGADGVQVAEIGPYSEHDVDREANSTSHMNRVHRFDMASLELRSKGHAVLATGLRPGGGNWQMPLLHATGSVRSPILVVTAAVHGNELEGVRAIPRVFQRLDPHRLKGTIVMVPVTNMPAFEANTRTSPIDNLNLARECPGKPDGTLTQRIADVLCQQLILQSDFYIDLHSGGPDMDIPTLVGYIHEESPVGRQSLAAAKAFGVPVLWGHPPPVPPGRTISVAHAAGIPSLYTETAGGGRAGLGAIEHYAQGVINVMSWLGMCSGAMEPQGPTLHLWGDGNLDFLISAPCAGLFESEVALLAEVKKGHRVGAIRDVWGQELCAVQSNRDGMLLFLRNTPTVNAGDGVAFVTGHYA